jgi:hypothetical protein
MNISTAIHKKIIERFNLEELRTFCFGLDVDYDTLGGEGKAGKARELVSLMQRKGRLDELIAAFEAQDQVTLQPAAPAAPAFEAQDQVTLQPAAPANPFGDAGRLADPAQFFDREELLRQIFEELRKGVNLSLVGETQAGKSSLLSMVCAKGPRRLGRPAGSFVYINLQWVDSEDDFYAALCDALAIEPCRGYELTRALRGKQCVVCLDEIEKMAWREFGFTARVRSQLRGLADGIGASLKLVIASRSALARLFPDSPELDSPLAGVCRQLDVGPFAPDVARAFVAHRLRGTGVAFAESELAALLAQSGGLPGKLQRLAADLYDAKRDT